MRYSEESQLIALPAQGGPADGRSVACWLLTRLLVASLPAVPALGAVSMQGLFSDHMVVQRDIPVPVFGAAAPNEAVTVKLGARQAEGKAGADGRFLVRLPAQEAGGPFELVVSGSNTLTFRDVYVGEVWIGSGQSNMDYRVDCTFSGCVLKDEAKEIAAADHPLIRSINIDRKGSATPTYAMTTGKWMVATPRTIGGFSAVGYFFARELQKGLPGVAIGIVHASYGASCIECWMSKESLAALPAFAPLLAQYERAPNHADQHEPYNCYNGQIFPVKPYAVRGVLWYQGESIKREPDNMGLYRDLQAELVRSWRREWGQDMTFVIAQLAGHNSSSFPVRREAQMQGALMVPNAGSVVTADLGDPANIHPPNKQDVGLRMSLVARALAYRQDVIPSGPVYSRMAVEGSSIRLFFKHAHGGLQLSGGNAATFEIAGAGGAYVSASARVDRESTLVVSSTTVAAPRNVRYAWSGLPALSLYSKSAPSLPGPSFRTDAPAFPEAPTALRRPLPRIAPTSGGVPRRSDLLGRKLHGLRSREAAP